MTALPTSNRGSLVAFGVWLFAVLITFGWLTQYGSTPGVAMRPPENWPNDSAIHHESGESSLLVFLHPDCPCSRATLDNLERIAEQHTIAITLVCLSDSHHETFESNWLTTGSCRGHVARWQSRPSIEVHRDIDGHEADRFRVTTSGHCLLFDELGNLRFSGGVTSRRGHEGNNSGLACLSSVIEGWSTGRKQFPVFGCPLKGSEPLATSNLASAETFIPSPCCENGNHHE
ncbi:hypothetical protein [Bremerella cremea]|uniref:hypothetical protein n=1 Tax=Bremerella cremea TaxID=1031537 RepID=UPI0031E59479